MFTSAIVKIPSRSLTNGLTSANLGQPNYEQALIQHGHYIAALQECGLTVHRLEADENFPDSTFIEDVALLTPHCAIITNPGAPSRRGETQGMERVLGKYFTEIEQVHSPGMVEAGDIMMVGAHFYIGLSERTNQAGAEQTIAILQKHGMTGSVIELEKVLHLKTGVAYLENNHLVACGEFLTHPDFKKFNIIEIDPAESYAANCIWVNDTVLVPAGFPQARDAIARTGYEVLELDVSEFQKLDGGLSCLSLRF